VVQDPCAGEAFYRISIYALENIGHPAAAVTLQVAGCGVWGAGFGLRVQVSALEVYIICVQVCTCNGIHMVCMYVRVTYIHTHTHARTHARTHTLQNTHIHSASLRACRSWSSGEKMTSLSKGVSSCACVRVCVRVRVRVCVFSVW